MKKEKKRDLIGAVGAAGLGMALIAVVITAALLIAGCAPRGDPRPTQDHVSLIGRAKDRYYALGETTKVIKSENVTIAPDRSVTTNINTTTETIRNSPAVEAFRAAAGIAKKSL